MSKKLTESDFITAARKLKAEVPVIKAVASVESRGQGFYADGFPVLLFERHKFSQFTGGKYKSSHPHLSGAAGGYGAPGLNQRRKFNEAFELNPIAAMKSCSWGLFQIMGFNHAACGFDTVGEFVDAMKESEGRQLLAFADFVIKNKLADKLRRKDWAGFAKGYNGAGYRKNKYDEKMAAAYKKFSKVSTVKTDVATSNKTATNTAFPSVEKTAAEPDVTGLNFKTEDSAAEISEIAEETSEGATETNEVATETVSTATVEQDGATVSKEVTQTNQQSVSDVEFVDQPEPQGLFKKLSAGVGSLIGGTFLYDGLGKFSGIQFSAHTIYILISLIVMGFLSFCVWAILDAWKSAQKVKLEIMTNTDINRKNIVWVKSE